MSKVARVFSSLGPLPGDVQKSIMTSCFPKLCDVGFLLFTHALVHSMPSQRLAAESITIPDPSTTELLLLIAKRYPQVFFKPLFLCAASNKEVIIANYLRILITLSTYLPNILTSNAEMMSVVLLGNLSNTGSTDEKHEPTWGRARIGHCVVVVELISRLRALRKNAVRLFSPPVERSNSSDRIGYLVRKSRCIRHFIRISIGHPVGSEGRSQNGRLSMYPCR